ncbi:unnamed protein product [Cylindrotheca closterium]|uniref:Uncharacterized protein n=1 Tax=Cylindrotheca closterium TaxID=2856 RepID=A0AAD2FCJ2_9STRA|nr:unnamed protein product [Cylindrotheca closterium]
MNDEYPPDLAGDSSMSTAALEEDMDTLMSDFDMPHGISANTSSHSSASPSFVTPSFKSVSATFQGEPFGPDHIAPAFDPLHQLMEPAPIFQSMEDASYRSVSPSDASSTCTNKSAAELDQLCKEGIEKLRESMKRSSATRQAVMRQRQALRF